MNKIKEGLVGFFVFFCVSILVFFLLTFEKFNLKNNYYLLKVKFHNVSNLEIGTPVLIAGVKIGKIENIYLEEDKVIVDLYIKKDVKIRKGAKVNLLLKGIIGDMIVSIYNPIKGEEYYKEGDILIGEDPLLLSSLIEKMSNTIDLVKNIEEQIEKLSLDKAGELIENVDKVSKNLNETIDQTKEVLKITKEAVENSNKLIKSTNTLIENTSGLISANKETIESSLKNIEKSIIKMDKMLDSSEKGVKDLTDSLKQLIADTRELIKGNSGNIEKSISNFEKTSLKTLEFAEKLNRQDIDKISNNIIDITEELKTTMKDIKGIFSEDDRAKISKAIKNTEEMTNKIVKIGQNKMSFESELEVNKDRDVKFNFNMRIFNEKQRNYIKIGKNDLNRDFGKLNLLIGKKIKNNLVGFGMINDKVGIEYSYLINERFFVGINYYDIQENNMEIQSGYQIGNAKIYLKYDIDDVFNAGVGYNF